MVDNNSLYIASFKEVLRNLEPEHLESVDGKKNFLEFSSILNNFNIFKLAVSLVLKHGIFCPIKPQQLICVEPDALFIVGEKELMLYLLKKERLWTVYFAYN